jgi:large subunit ribosomal protein L4
MMELKLIDTKGKSAANIQGSDNLFGQEYNEALVHQVVTAYFANARGATRKQKARSDIAKSTRKPWKQKGTGRARAGMASSPLWRGGGKIFPNLPDENFSHKVNKRMYRAGMRAILSQLVREDRLAVIESISIDSVKTKELAKRINMLGYADVLIITDEIDRNLALSARNIPRVRVTDVGHTDPVSLMQFEHVVMTKKAVAKMEELLV